MWNKPWKNVEAFVIGLGLILTGMSLQLAVGQIEWQLFAWPANIITLTVYAVLVVTAYLMRKRMYLVQFCMTPPAAVASLCYATLLTALMGLTRQTAEVPMPGDWLGLTRMLSSWPFVLSYLWLTTCVALTTLQQLHHFNRRRLPAVVCHIGIVIVISCGTLGSADMQRLKMYCMVGTPEWRALDNRGNVSQMPLAIQLNKFILEEYPAELQKVRGADGKPTMMRMPTPKRYASEVEIYTQKGEVFRATIDVNHPVTVEGWKIYQYSYDTAMGARSQLSILELVADPWMPAVYVGIFMLLAGAILMFVTPSVSSALAQPDTPLSPYKHKN